MYLVSVNLFSYDTLLFIYIYDLLLLGAAYPPSTQPVSICNGNKPICNVINLAVCGCKAEGTLVC